MGCHGSGDNPAPPVDVLGRSDPSLQTVGAHREHLEALHRVSAPVTCNECHLVPTQLFSPGHIDHVPPAVVFPPDAGVLARADGAVPSYNAATATCTSYCHGSGASLSQDTSAERESNAPRFNGGPGQAACGSCHGIPPQVPGSPTRRRPSASAPAATRKTVTSAGNIIVDSAGNSTHVNGVVDFWVVRRLGRGKGRAGREEEPGA